MSIEDIVLEVFREIFDDPELEISNETNASDIEGWDSFNHITLIVELEDKFDIQFTTKEIGSMTCVGDLYEILKEKDASA